MKRIGGTSPRHMARAILEAVDDKERDDEEREDKDELSLAGPPDDIDKVVADEPKEDPPFAPDANMVIKDQEEPVSDAGNDVEALAGVAHESWSGWMGYLFEKSQDNEDGSVTIPKDQVDRWRRQVATPYAELSEEEKESDREEARKYIAALGDEEEAVFNEPGEIPTGPGMIKDDGGEDDGDGGDDVKAKVLDFIVGERAPDDSAVHRFAQELGMEPDDLEGVVYSILGSLAAGKARAAGLRKENVDPDELAKGIEVEAEHTDNRLVAEMIAMDHLAEFPDYYTRLETMENEARKAGSASDVPTGGDDGPPRPPTSWPNPSDGRRAPYHSMHPHDDAGEDDG